MPQSQHRTKLLLSMTLLIALYGAFGWLVKNWQVPPKWLGILAITTLVIDIIAVYPYHLIEVFFTGIFGVDWRSLILVAFVATTIVAIIAWLPIVYYVVLMLIATLLLRLDFYELKYNHWQSFLLLMVCQMGGLGLGLVGSIYWWRGVEYLRRYHSLGL